MSNGFTIDGRFRVEPDLHRIVGPEGPVRVESRLMSLLEILARRPGETLTRAELLEAIWGDRHVAEESLTAAVSRLRRVLGDDPRRPRVILTVPKRGYRLIAEIGELPSGSGSKPRRSWAGWLAALAAAMAVLAVAQQGLHRPATGGPTAGEPAAGEPATAALYPTPLTSHPGVEFDAAFSPDGERIAYVWGGPDGDDLDIWVQRIGDAWPRRITSRPGFDGSPSWSPDGTRIAYMHSDNGRTGTCGVFVAALDSGDERRLAACSAHSESSVAWSARDQIVFADRPGSDQPFRLYRVSTNTLEVEPLTSPPAGSIGDLDPAFARDGSALAFVRGTNASLLPPYVSPVLGDIWVLDLESGRERQLTQDNEDVPGLAWTLDGRRIVYASNRDSGRYALWEVDVTGGEPRWLLSLDGMVRNPVPYRGGLAFELSRGDFDLWRISLEGGAEPLRLSGSTRSEVSPDFSPDGEQLVFVSDRTGSPEVWRSAVDGSSPRRLTDLGAASTARPRWSPNGNTIAFDSRHRGGTSIWSVAAHGGPPRRLTEHHGTPLRHDLAPSWSADGTSIYFGSNRDGDWQIWRVAVAGGPPIRMTESGGFAALAVPSLGGDLYYVALERPGIWRRAAAGGQESLVVADHWQKDWANWAAAGTSMFYLRRTGWTSGILERINVADGTSEPLAVVESDHNLILSGMTVSPDASAIVYAQRTSLAFDLMRVEGYR